MRRKKQLVVSVTAVKSLHSLKATMKELVCAVTSVLVLSLGARIKVVAPFTPVPFTLQTMALHYLLFIHGAKAWKYVATYVLLGLAGVPVFAYGGGLTYVLSPTFGYITGFVVGTLIAGKLLPQGTLSAKRGLLAGSIQLLVIYAAGALWLTAWYMLIKGADPLQALVTAVVTGILPFAIWDVVKLCLAIPLSRSTIAAYYALVKRFQSRSSSRQHR